MSLQLFMEKLRLLCFTLQCHSECSSLASCSVSAVLTNGGAFAEGDHAPDLVSSSCVLSHMFFTLMRRCVTLPAGRSWQSNKPCMKCYQLVETPAEWLSLRVLVLLQGLTFFPHFSSMLTSTSINWPWLLGFLLLSSSLNLSAEKQV